MSRASVSSPPYAAKIGWQMIDQVVSASLTANDMRGFFMLAGEMDTKNIVRSPVRKLADKWAVRERDAYKAMGRLRSCGMVRRVKDGYLLNPMMVWRGGDSAWRSAMEMWVEAGKRRES